MKCTAPNPFCECTKCFHDRHSALRLVNANTYSATQPQMILGVCNHDDCPRHKCKQNPPFYAAILNKKRKRKP